MAMLAFVAIPNACTEFVPFGTDRFIERYATVPLTHQPILILPSFLWLSFAFFSPLRVLSDQASFIIVASPFFSASVLTDFFPVSSILSPSLTLFYNFTPNPPS